MSSHSLHIRGHWSNHRYLGDGAKEKFSPCSFLLPSTHWPEGLVSSSEILSKTHKVAILTRKNGKNVMVPATPLTLCQREMQIPKCHCLLGCCELLQLLGLCQSASPYVPGFRPHIESSPCGCNEAFSLYTDFRRSSHP